MKFKISQICIICLTPTPTIKSLRSIAQFLREGVKVVHALIDVHANQSVQINPEPEEEEHVKL